ncbi:hypothetical protein H3146_00825 [Streptomyces sp. OF3]|uniref:Uncharacterized protein n=1 Tax=Streptomyces alkaliterrae TaxID=2213162 RepID=A0A7W3WGF0_9ACTN|nr:hypothetical protein [Streptomyces alkaliterrae]MBB1251913.1 hypothetical protein [Streptomyces alkaliterrae]
MHGNELRKARLHGAVVDRLLHATSLAPDCDSRASALPLLARAAGELRDQPLSDRAMRETDQLLDEAEHTSLFNRARCTRSACAGSATGRITAAIHLTEQGSSVPTTTVAPQWRVIELVTVSHVRLLAADAAGAVDSLRLALHEAVPQRLPHQLQRIMRAAGNRLPELPRVS